jgi:hypothetical protein
MSFVKNLLAVLSSEKQSLLKQALPKRWSQHSELTRQGHVKYSARLPVNLKQVGELQEAAAKCAKAHAGINCVFAVDRLTITAESHAMARSFLEDMSVNPESLAIETPKSSGRAQYRSSNTPDETPRSKLFFSSRAARHISSSLTDAIDYNAIDRFLFSLDDFLKTIELNEAGNVLGFNLNTAGSWLTAHLKLNLEVCSGGATYEGNDAKKVFAEMLTTGADIKATLKDRSQLKQIAGAPESDPVIADILSLCRAATSGSVAHRTAGLRR